MALAVSIIATLRDATSSALTAECAAEG